MIWLYKLIKAYFTNHKCSLKQHQQYHPIGQCAVDTRMTNIVDGYFFHQQPMICDKD